ncbi:hypothetical protein AX16_002989 [Volvariella volvacea WC 439]|nr:hypothetical protein AX16_002989 [Volvariella volvacea WC 439]
MLYPELCVPSIRITAAFLTFQNIYQQAARRRLGKAAVVVDTSLEEYQGYSSRVVAADQSQERDQIERLQNEGDDPKDQGIVESQTEAVAVAKNEKAFDDLTQSEDFILSYRILDPRW